MSLISIMYHTIGNPDANRAPIFKGLTREEFTGQLDYLLRHHQPLDPQTLVRSAQTGEPLPDNGFVLTFDHGSDDHTKIALEELEKRDLKAFFFVMTIVLEDGVIPIIDKQRFLEGSFADYQSFLKPFCEKSIEISGAPAQEIYPGPAQLLTAREYLKEFHFYSDQERLFRKIRNDYLTWDQFCTIIEALFAEHVGPEHDIASQYYMNWSEVDTLHQAGMTVGSHGHNHLIYDGKNHSDCCADMGRSFEILRDHFGTAVNTMSYPNGAHHELYISFLEKIDIDISFTTRVGVAFDPAHSLSIDRLDATHVPLRADAPLSSWSRAMFDARGVSAGMAPVG